MFIITPPWFTIRQELIAVRTDVHAHHPAQNLSDLSESAAQSRFRPGDERMPPPARGTISEKPSIEPPFVDPRYLRAVLGSFASGVVVVTGVDADGPLGFTCQSFASLSLDPPLISFCPARTSTTWPRLRAQGRFCVNVLSQDHEAHSARFARSGGDKFAALDWRPAPSGAPLLGGVCAWIDCELWREYDGGDHTVVVGRVTALAADTSRPPLLFHRGTYVATRRAGAAAGSA